jgi:short-subunit dehydrogenase
MKKQVVLIFGDTGGIGSATRKMFLEHGFRIIPVNRGILDFNTPNADKEIRTLLAQAAPDVVVNCAGIFENGWDHSYTKTMNINFGSNWSIIRHYMDPTYQKNKTRIILIGSSSYNGGRKLYPLYSASKAALFNLWQAAKDGLENTVVQVDLVNPVRTLTKMSAAGRDIDGSLQYLQPEQVAEQICQLVKENQSSRCIDMTFEDKK